MSVLFNASPDLENFRIAARMLGSCNSAYLLMSRFMLGGWSAGRTRLMPFPGLNQRDCRSITMYAGSSPHLGHTSSSGADRWHATKQRPRRTIVCCRTPEPDLRDARKAAAAAYDDLELYMNETRVSQKPRLNSITRPKSSALRRENRPWFPQSKATMCSVGHTHTTTVTYHKRRGRKTHIIIPPKQRDYDSQKE